MTKKPLSTRTSGRARKITIMGISFILALKGQVRSLASTAHQQDWLATRVNQYTAGCGSAYAQSRRVDNESCSLSVMSTSKAVPSSVEGTGGLPQVTNILRGAEVLTPSRVGETTRLARCLLCPPARLVGYPV